MILLVGGMDSSGGAGLLRDTATAAALGAPVRAVVTAVTAQSDAGVRAVQVLPPAMIRAQVLAATESPVRAIKIGMLADAATIEALSETLPQVPLILDPVLAATSGRALITAEGLACLIERLLPRTTLLTPNLPELARLARALGVGPEDALPAILARGPAAVLVKGGHAQGPQVTDLLWRRGAPPLAFTSRRLPGTLRGTGCQLATALAVHLARNLPLDKAITSARHSVAARFEALAQPPDPHPSPGGQAF